MSLVDCAICDNDILTESDPYLVIPHCSRYHPVCLTCVLENSNVADDAKAVSAKLLARVLWGIDDRT